MPIRQTPNHAKFCGDPTRSVGDIHDRKFVLFEKVDQSSSNFQGILLTKAPNERKFCRIRLQMWEIFAIKNFCSQKKWAKIHHNHVSSRLVKPSWRKALQIFLHPSIFWLPRVTPWAKGHRSGWCVGYTNPNYLQNFGSETLGLVSLM